MPLNTTSPSCSIIFNNQSFSHSERLLEKPTERNKCNKKDKTKRGCNHTSLSLSANPFVSPESYSHAWLLKGFENLFLHAQPNRLHYCRVLLSEYNYLILSKQDEPLASGDRNSRLTSAAPVSCPISVILFGSPPKEPMFFLTQRIPAAMSLMPKLTSSGSVLSTAVFVLRKPETKEQYVYFCFNFVDH